MSASTQSLVSIFAENVQSKAQKVALRHKQLGIWQEWTWLDLAHVVQKYVAVLNEFKINFESEKNLSLLISSSPNVHFFAFSIASQILGISVQLIESQQQQHDSNLFLSLQIIQPDLIFIEDLKQLDDRTTLGLNPTLNLNSIIFYLQDNRLNPKQLNHTYSILDRINQFDDLQFNDLQFNGLEFNHPNNKALKHPAEPNEFDEKQIAFIFHKIKSGQHFYAFYHAQSLIEEAENLIETHHLNHDEQAFITRGFASHDHIRYLFTSWLIAGFCLNIPENFETRDQDRQMISPTLIIGTSSTYARAENIVQQKLPNLNSGLFKIFPNLKNWHSSFSNPQSNTSGLFETLFNAFFKQSILASLGFSNLRTAIVVGESSSERTRQFYQRLGIKLSSWQSQTYWKNKQFDPKSDPSSDLKTFNYHSSSGEPHVHPHHP